MKLAQIRLFFRLIKHPPQQHRKQELWERDLSFYQRAKINGRVKWRRFDTQTRGMGFIFVLLMALMIVINIIPLIFSSVIRQIESAPYKEALAFSCKDKDFYNWHFKDCESAGVRP